MNRCITEAGRYWTRIDQWTAFEGHYYIDYAPNSHELLMYCNYDNPIFDGENRFHRGPKWLVMA